MGNISFARRYLEPEGQACERIEAAAKAAARAQGLTRQLLTFSKGGEPIKRLGSVSELLKDCTTFALRGSNVDSQFRIPPDLWNVEMDETQVAQVIHNLVINAIQAMQQGGTVRIRAENVVVPEGNRFPLRHGRYVKVAVADEGVGVPREHIRKVFDPYFTTKAGGTGLGLATAYSVIKKHGGLITVDSRPGKGTTFYFFLPAVLAKADSTNHDKQETRQGMGRVLVMDDEESIRDLSKELLQVCGYKVAVARHGMEALRIYKEAMKAGRPFDAVIMDLTIPGGMGGKETLRELLTFDPKAKAIVSSGYFNDPLMSDYERFGFKGVLPKPYDAGQITVVLEKVLRPNRG
jgi:CheY-like chemotaxis protein